VQIRQTEDGYQIQILRLFPVFPQPLQRSVQQRILKKQIIARISRQGIFRKYQELLKDERNVEMLKTLKVYLESNMNYSVTAEKMYVHINTVRKRMERAHELLDIDWDQRLSLLNAELLLHFLKFPSTDQPAG